MQRTVARAGLLAGSGLIRSARPQIQLASRTLAAATSQTVQKRCYHEKDECSPLFGFAGFCDTFASFDVSMTHSPRNHLTNNKWETIVPGYKANILSTDRPL